ncbi:carboxypeptidase regulatory-like domain-containing protein [Planctomycetaceae bacterium SH139]
MKWYLAIGLLLVTGCGGPAVLPVEGVVQFEDGEPAKTGVIEFRAADGLWRGSGRLDDKGHFSITSVDGEAGLPAGLYYVIVAQMVITEDLSLEQHGHGRPVPQKYADYYTSGLEQTISEENSKSLVVELVSSP